MAVSGNLVPVAKLATMLHLTLAPDDDYANIIISAASNAVRDAARQAGWVRLDDGDVAGTGQTEAPSSAQDITLWLALRAYSNPRNLARKTTGPISESYFENGVYGLELTPDERTRLEGMRTEGAGGGLWAQPIYGGKRRTEHVYIPSELNPPGAPFYMAEEWQFPYGLAD